MKRMHFYMLILLLPFLILSCGRDDFWDQFGSDNKIPSSISFIDVNPDEDFLTGAVTIGKASDEKNVTQYKLYWGSSASAKYSSAPIAVFSADGTDKTYTFTNEHVPSGATHLLALTANSSGDMTKYKAIDFEDIVVKMEKDIHTLASSSPVWFVEMGGKIYFFAIDSVSNFVFRSYDPSTGLLSVIKHALETAAYEVNDELKIFAFSYKGWIYYKSRIAASPAPNQFRLFRFNESNPVEPVPDVFDLERPFINTDNDMLYFFADNLANQLDLYSFDTTSSFPIPGVAVTNITNSGGSLSLLANTKIVYNKSNSTYYYIIFNTGYKLFSYTIAAPIPINTFTAANGEIFVFNDKLYFGAENDGSGYEVWEYNPSTTIFTRISNINISGDSFPSSFFSWQNYLYFIADDSDGYELYRTDGSTVLPINEINSSALDAFDTSIPLFLNFKYYKNKLYMRADSSAIGNNRELWVTDGIPGGDTHNVHNPDPLGDSQVLLGNIFQDRLFYKDTLTDYLWFYDPDKMSIPLKIQTSTGIDPSTGVIYNNKMYFAGSYPGLGRELWVLYYK